MPIELLVNGFLEGSRIALAGMGFALIFYTTKELHFAYGVLIALAGYVCYWLIAVMGLNAFLAVPVSLAIGAASGAAVQRFLYRRLPDHLSVLLFSFGLAILLENLLHLGFGPNDLILPAGPLTEGVVLFDRIYVRVIDLVALAVFAAVWAFMWYLLARRRMGLALRAVMHDEDASELVGIKSGQVKLFAYAMGSLIGALAGLINVTRAGVRPGAGFDLMLFAFIITLLGIGKMHRVVLWGIGLGVFMSLVAWQLPTEMRTLLAFAGMLIYLVARTRERPAILRRRRLSAATAEGAG